MEEERQVAAGRRVGVGLLVGVLVAAAAGVAVFAHDGYRIYIVHTGSMVPTYDPGDVVIDKPSGALRPGEVITFLHSGLSSDLVTHRITDLQDGVIHTKGDANRTPDVWNIRPDQVKGVVIYSVPRAGYALVYLKSPLGIASVVTSVLSLFLLYALFFPSPPPPTAPVSGSRHAMPTGGRHRLVATEPSELPAPHSKHARRAAAHATQTE